MVFIVPPKGQQFAVDVNHNATTLYQLKVEIEKINGMPVSNQRFFFSQSNDSDLICNLGIGRFSILILLNLVNPFYGETPSSVASPNAAVKDLKWKTIGATSSSVVKVSEEDKELDPFYGKTPSSVASPSAAVKRKTIGANLLQCGEGVEIDGGGGEGIRMKAQEYFDRKLQEDYVDSESDEDIKRADADFELACERTNAKISEIIDAEEKLDVESIAKEIKVKNVQSIVRNHRC